MRRSIVAMSTILLLGSGCGGDGGSSSPPTVAPEVTGPTDATAGTGPAAPTGASGGTGVSGASGATSGACIPESPTSTGWRARTSITGDLTFSLPRGWTDESGDIGADADSFLAPETLAEIGLTGDEPAPVDNYNDPETGDSILVFRFEGVTSTLEELFARQEALLSAPKSNEVLETGLSACVGGEAALGLHLGSKEETFPRQQVWYVVERDGSLYFVALDAFLDDNGAIDTDVLAEVLRTWRWTT